jgi:hypothetical protein
MVMPIMTQNANRTSRKMARISSTMTTARAPFSTSSDSRSRKSRAALPLMRTSTPAGRVPWTSSTMRCTAAAISSGDWLPIR